MKQSRILKICLSPGEGVRSLELPKGTELLTVTGEESGQVTVWALAPGEEVQEAETKWFRVVISSNPFGEVVKKFLGTVRFTFQEAPPSNLTLPGMRPGQMLTTIVNVFVFEIEQPKEKVSTSGSSIII